MKIAIVTILTGNYADKFSKILIDSIHKYFLPHHDKRIIVFSDKYINGVDNLIYVDYLPPPLNTLLRYHYFLKLNWASFDYFYYLDGDCQIVDTIGDDILVDGKISIPIHPLKRDWENHFEQNQNSTAFVENSSPTQPYYQCCFFGGDSETILKASSTISKNIDIDLNNRIVAKWHDESHMNKFLINNPVNALSGEYAYPNPDTWNVKWPFPKKIIHYNHANIPI